MPDRSFDLNGDYLYTIAQFAEVSFVNASGVATGVAFPLDVIGAHAVPRKAADPFSIVGSTLKVSGPGVFLVEIQARVDSPADTILQLKVGATVVQRAFTAFAITGGTDMVYMVKTVTVNDPATDVISFVPVFSGGGTCSVESQYSTLVVRRLSRLSYPLASVGLSLVDPETI